VRLVEATPNDGIVLGLDDDVDEQRALDLARAAGDVTPFSPRSDLGLLGPGSARIGPLIVRAAESEGAKIRTAPVADRDAWRSAS
jgi:hypothetical protein